MASNSAWKSIPKWTDGLVGKVLEGTLGLSVSIRGEVG
jgi:hypothetical protein